MQLRLFPVMLVCVGAMLSNAVACLVPVFRYALDRWPTDAFKLEAPAADLKYDCIAADLRGDHGSIINLEALASEQTDTAKLMFPSSSSEEPKLAWIGKLSSEAYDSLTTSPARKEITKRILNGDSAVWVIVEDQPASGNPALIQLEQTLRNIEATATFHERPANDPSNQIGPGPELKIKFSVVRIAKNDTTEQSLIAMLAGPKGIDRFAGTGAFAALVFGRGRVLGAWDLATLDVKLIDEASRFLLAPCSCEAKQLNPGWDLLMRVNWEAELAAIGTGVAKESPVPAMIQPETVVYRPRATPATTPERSRTKTLLICGLGLLAIILTVVTWKRTQGTE